MSDELPRPPDRGALVLAPSAGDPSYRGVYRPPLDAQRFTGKRGRALGERYRALLAEGDGVLEDLDEALALRDEAARIGVGALDVIVFEVPQEPPPAPRSLPVAPTPPAPELRLLGYDVIEQLEPYWSALSAAPDAPPARNEVGLLAHRLDAERFAEEHNARPSTEDRVTAVRVWLAPPAPFTKPA